MNKTQTTVYKGGEKKKTTIKKTGKGSAQWKEEPKGKKNGQKVNCKIRNQN